jgi:HEAT repeat protein
MIQAVSFTFPWNAQDILLLVVFGVLIVIGRQIIMREVKIIKQEAFTVKEQASALIFGALFSTAVCTGLVVAIQYISEVKLPFHIGPPAPPVLLPEFTGLMFMIIYGVLAVFPLLDLIWLALGSKQTSPLAVQNALNRWILAKIGNKKARVEVACGLYVLVFWVPVALLQLAGVPWLITSLLLFQIFPVFLLNQLGSIGYFWGVNLHYYNILEKERFIYEVLDNNKAKIQAEFKENFVPIVAFPVMLFVYVNSFISLGEFIGIAAGVLPQTLSFTFLISVATTTISALVGYFTKYWRKQVKFQIPEIVFAGYLFCSLSFELFVNFLVKQPAISNSIFGGSVIGLLNPDKYLFLIPLVFVEKGVFAGFVTWYFLRTGGFKANVLDSIIVLAKSRLNPRPLFNMSRHPDRALRTEAVATLDEMYRMHSMPYIAPPETKKKSGFISVISVFMKSMLNPKRLKQAPFSHVFESLGSDHQTIRSVASRLLPYMAYDDPAQFAARVEGVFSKADTRPAALVLGALSAMDPSKIQNIHVEAILGAMETGDLQVIANGFDVVKLYQDQVKASASAKQSLERAIAAAINCPDTAIQVKCLAFLEEINVARLELFISIPSVLTKLNHPSHAVKEAAILLLDKFEDTAFDPSQLTTITDLLHDKSPRLQIAALRTLNKIIDRSEIDILPREVHDLIDAHDLDVASHAIILAAKLAKKQPGDFKPATIVAALRRMELRSTLRLMQDIESFVLEVPEDFLPFLTTAMDQTDLEIKDIAKRLFVMIGVSNLDLVMDTILGFHEDSRFSVRNYTTEILFEIGKRIPDEVIPLLHRVFISDPGMKNFGNAIPFLQRIAEAHTEAENENFRINAATVIGELGELFPSKMDIPRLLAAAQKDASWRVRRDLATSLGKLAIKVEGFPIKAYFSLLDDENAHVRTAVMKSIVQIAKEKPTMVPIQDIAIKAQDPDEAVREAAIKTIGFAAVAKPETAMPYLIDGLADEKWPVREAAAEAMGRVAKSAPDHVPVGLLKDMFLTGPDKWTRVQASKALAEIVKVRPKLLTLADLKNFDHLGDEQLIAAFLNLLRSVDPRPVEQFLGIIRPYMAMTNTTTQDEVTTTIYQVFGKTYEERLLSELLKMVADKSTPEAIMHAAAISLGKIAKYAKGAIKKRVKAVLNAAAQHSRDPVIMKELTAL